MRAPLSWLRDFAPFAGDPVELAATFDDLGMVVEGVERIGEGLGDVVIAKVLEIDGIKGADKIRRVLVDTGGAEPLQVVCGAWNFDVGAVVPFVGVGAVLPGGFEIGRRKMKGVESNGMICSANELGLGDDHAGIMVLDPSLPAGAPFVEALGIETDVVFDLDIEGNRPDALCIAGIARDAAARLGLPFHIPEPKALAPAKAVAAPVKIDAPDLCPRFTATLLSGVTVGPSPAWLARRLTLAGMRPINNIVDISNYVMLELGQPTHPYDIEQLPGGGLSARRAGPGERLTTLDGVERVLGDGDDCLIGDAEGTAVGIGGIMGGSSSEISATTTEVLLEAAWFDPMAIARTSKRLGLRSEASARFEKGVDYGGIDRAVARFAELAVELAGAAVGATTDVRSAEHLPAPRTIRLRTARVNRVLGTDIDDATILRLLESIGFQVAGAGAGEHDVTVPSFRLDVQEGEIDLIEEVARHYGYARIARTVPSSPAVGRLSTFQQQRRRIRDVLAGGGVSEAMTALLIGPGDHERAGLAAAEEAAIEAERPLAIEESRLRASLLPGLLRALAFNAGHRHPDVALFEVGHTFRRPATPQPLPVEDERLSVILGMADAGAAKHVLDLLVDALRIDAVHLTPAETPGLHPTRTASVTVGGTVVGFVGEVDPDVLAEWGLAGRAGWLDVDLHALLAGPRRPLEAAPVSRFPSSDIDLAFTVPDSIPAGAVEQTLRAAGGELLVSVALFDVYRGTGVPDGHRSVAYRLRFQALDRTLTDAEVSAIRAKAIAAVEQGHGARLR